MFVYEDQTLVGTYAVALGGNAEGHRQQEGDRRTAEGEYVLDCKNPKRAYPLSIHISCPDKSDREQARNRRLRPSGDIMIHRQPNKTEFRQYLAGHPGMDWTDGGVALSNQDMDAPWTRIRVPVGIEIRP